jgi:DNA-binding response OmpR family regulator/anti-sigma regulatory factor (Ser/Thr protein kinase)
VKILIADDDPISLAVLRAAIQKFRHEVVAVSDGVEAWNLLQEPDAPQIAILDWLMPSLDGVEICRRLRSRASHDICYIILLTSQTDPKDMVRGLQAGADDFLYKPFNPAELQARVEVGRRLVRLYNRQQLNLELAQKLLVAANMGLPRWVSVSDELTLHLTDLSFSPQRAGGDHCWARTRPANGDGGPVTIIGLRDQSGHEVNCILRSIATDLFHKEAIEAGAGLEDQMARLNDHLCSCGLFAEDDFLTALTLELDHATLRLRYVSCGHPPMFLIRDKEVTLLPEENGPGRNLPLGTLSGRSFEAGECQLRAGDRLILYTDGLFELGPESRAGLLSAEQLRQLIGSLLLDHPDMPVSRLLPKLLALVMGNPTQLSVSSPPDDVTVLGIEIELDSGPHEAVIYPSTLKDIDGAVSEIHQRLLSDWGVESCGMPRLRLFLDEVLTNAWTHGNRRNPSLPIRVQWGRRNGFSIEVEDTGPGFIPQEVLDPRSPERVMEERGRGVYLMRGCCEWMQWKRNGARLVARLARQPAASLAGSAHGAGRTDHPATPARACPQFQKTVPQPV